ncbi:TatD family hydrolase [Telmatocola sphagniphila]|uniref:TatD family hydrolase n=1 Tax=Telmatocola sphagniphila TaxID=1123043 RepID=A0A8E6B9W7_9BACT|nr:TatD family hydrolase [Telmatocola sphagniphila]QVL33243.1 TatD family hydrolase [Telmatocola sphagniphila]
MTYPIIDTHAHLDDNRFQTDLAQVLQRSLDAGLERIITIGIDRETSEASVSLAAKHPLLRAAVAIQPNHVHEINPGDWERIQELARDPSVVAIGETGLDRYWKKAPFDLQIEYFFKHLDYAAELNLPVIIHCREAEQDIVDCLKKHFEKRGPVAGVMHSFTGSPEVAEACLACGLHISYAGMVTFKNAEEIRLAARRIPEDRLLVETDSPYLAPMPHRGRRNEPAFVKHTLEFLAELRGVSEAHLGVATTVNARKLFKLPNPS